jgi:hypothetical protein
LDIGINFQTNDLSVVFSSQADGPATKDVVEAGIIDLYSTKYWGIKFATAAANTVLRVDQVRSGFCQSRAKKPLSLKKYSL